jgi:hypothetical protein
MNRTPNHTERFSLFDHLQHIPEQPKPLDPDVYLGLPYDLPPKDQEAIDRARRILDERDRKRDRIWDQLANHWGLRE